MKTIKLKDEAFIILAQFKIFGGYKTYSETIIALEKYIKDLITYKQKYLNEN